ncbi:type IV conjugative transfer system protein TraE (plasmid) [Aeromonas sp. FDAARGOS 1405]|uniref:type IV conjugative transfer system protein TraE n=1 Tax=Aeromonas TaxID=642 RepID=UPI001C22B3DF|nr:type IV conjugative transfer system protein TraE [Aeromonas sp. FDAARGOS 1405]QXB31776.1 type IV conjugative transfer system protein TraE [Aeromonas sp. FDAARGOS 1405]
MRSLLNRLGGQKKPRRDGLLNDEQRIQADRKLIKICVIISVAIGALNYQSIEDLKENGKTILIPFGVKQGDMWISGTDASNTYLRRVADLIIANYKNISAASVAYKYADLLAMTDSSTSGFLRDKLMKKSAELQQYPSVSYSAELQYDKPISVEPITDVSSLPEPLRKVKNPYKMTVKASAYSHVGDTRQPGKSITINVFYTISNGQFSLLDIEG